MSIALDLERPGYEKVHAAGVTYDFRKSFDLIPIATTLRILEERGIDGRISVPLRSMYDGLRRVFRLRGAVGDRFRSYNGIIQGDALSMVAVTHVRLSVSPRAPA